MRVTHREYLSLDHSLEEVKGILKPVVLKDNKMYEVLFISSNEIELKEVISNEANDSQD